MKNIKQSVIPPQAGSVVEVLKRHLAFGILLFLSSNVIAQNDFTVYNLRNTPQSSYLNPAFIPQYNFFIGLPAISSMSFSFGHSGFAYTDLIHKRSDDSLFIDMDNMIAKLGKKNFLSVNASADLLSFGFKVKKNWITFNATEKVSARFSYPKDLIRFAVEGNGAFLGETADFSGISINAVHYREYAIGYARTIGNKITFGLKAKYLYGMENVYTEKSNLGIYTDESTFDITANSDFRISTSGLQTFGKTGITDYAFKRNNHGFAADIGLDVKLNKHFSVAASALNLGFINWKSDVKNYSGNNQSFTFSGIDVTKLTAENGSTDFTQELLDSLTNTFKIEETIEAYTSKLSPSYYLSASCSINPNNIFTVTGYMETSGKNINPAFTVAFAKRVANKLSFNISYSMENRSYNNAGFGFSVDMGPLQWYLACDNVLGVFLPQNTRTLQYHGGINLVFAKNVKKVKPEKKQPEKVERKGGPKF